MKDRRRVVLRRIPDRGWKPSRATALARCIGFRCNPRQPTPAPILQGQPGIIHPPTICERTDQVLKLSPCLFNNTILAFQHDSHPTEIPDFRSAHYQGLDIETPSGEDTRDPRQHTRLVLYQAIKDMATKPFKENSENFYDATHFLKGCNDGGGVL